MDKEVKDLAKQIMQNAPKQSPHRNVKTEGQLIFGPYVPLCKVHDGLINGLLKRGDKLTPGDKNPTLAGQLKDQRGYTIVLVSTIGHKNKLEIFVDESLNRFKNLYAAAGHPNCIFKINFDELLNLTNGVVKDIVE